MPVPENWYEMNTHEHKVYFKDGPTLWTGEPRKLICNAEVAREYFEYERKEMNAKVGRMVSDAIEQTKLFKRTSNKVNFGVYGSALAWVRIAETGEGKESINNIDGTVITGVNVIDKPYRKRDLYADDRREREEQKGTKKKKKKDEPETFKTKFRRSNPKRD